MTPQEIAQSIIVAGDRLAEMKAAADRIANGRGEAKWAAVNRLVSLGVMTSLSAAEKYARKDAEYDAYCEAQVLAEAAEIKARAYYEACKVRGWLAAAQVAA